MQEILTNEDIINENNIRVYSKSVYHHVINVMRKVVGNKLVLLSQTNLTKNDYISYDKYEVEISFIDLDYFNCKIISKNKALKSIPLEITVYQAIAKSDRIEYFLEKATELGASTFKLTEYDRNVVKLDSKKALKKLERWEKIVGSAVKQSKRNTFPLIKHIKKLDIKEIELSSYDLKILMYENEKENIGVKSILESKVSLAASKDTFKVAIFVGPEGGFTDSEVELLKKAGAESVLLGENILRTETAALALISIVQYVYGGF